MFAKRTNWELKTNRYTEALESARREGRKLLDLTVSNPTTCGLERDPRILQALADERGARYEPEALGMAGARAAVAGYYEALGVAVAAENILLTTSTSEAYSYAFRLLCEPGDEVLVPEPGYPLFDFLASIQDVKPVAYPLIYDHGWHMDLHALEQAITPRTRGVIVVHPNNPTGSFVSGEERRALAALCGARGLAIVADEVFLDYGLYGRPHSFADERKCLTLTLSGLSKTAGLPQMKVAWMVASGPEELHLQAMARLEVIADTYLSVNTPMQLALPVMLEARHGFQKQLKARLAANLRELDSQLAGAPQVSRLEVQGGWYATLRVPATQPDEELAIKLIGKGVIVQPGHFFDFPKDGYLVVSLMTEEKEFGAGIRVICNL